MLTTSFLTILVWLINIIMTPVFLLPDVSLPENITNALSTANSYLAPIDLVFPLSTLVAILTLYVVIEGAILLYKITMWVLKKIPGIN